MPINIETLIERKYRELWEAGRAPEVPPALLVPTEQALRVFAINGVEYTFTTARIYRGNRASQSAWWCKTQDIRFPARSLTEKASENMVVDPRGVIVSEQEFIIEAASRPIREHQCTQAEFNSLGTVEALLQLAAWCVSQHRIRPNELETVGLTHAPGCVVGSASRTEPVSRKT